MKKRQAFSLIELMVAILIFSFMLMSMSSMYVTAEKHMMQNYRYDRLRTSLTAAARFLKNTSAQGTMIYRPTDTLPNSNFNVLAFASNVDYKTGCYPINSGVEARWHYFCMTRCPAQYTGTSGFGAPQCLYYHTQQILGGGGCPGGAAWNAAGSFPVTCGIQTRGATEKVVLLLPYVTTPTTAPNFLFSRNGLERNIVKTSIRVQWSPPASLSNVSRTVDTTLETYLAFNVIGQ
ncbi:MAG: hypothetical protein Fur0012_09930 [Elusimicrobiota bacterium]